MRNLKNFWEAYQYLIFESKRLNLSNLLDRLQAINGV